MSGAARRRFNPLSGLSRGKDRGEGDGRLTQALASLLLVVFLACIVLYGLSQLAPVPDITGMSREQAESTLEKAGFTVGSEQERPADPGQNGKVVEQTPRAGARVLAGSAVSIVVANGLSAALDGGSSEEGPGARASEGTTMPFWGGNPPRTATIVPYDSPADPSGVRVPTVLGLSQSAALSALSASGFSGVVRTAKSTTNVPTGTVVGQKPGAESYVAAGSTVYIYISTGAPTGTPYQQAPYSN